MNNARRKEIYECIEELENLKQKIEYIRDDEEESYSNLPESIQYSERGDTMQENVDELEDAIGQLGDVVDILQEIYDK